MAPPCKDQGEAGARDDDDIKPGPRQKTITNASSPATTQPLAEIKSATRYMAPASAQTNSRNFTQHEPIGADEGGSATDDAPELASNVTLSPFNTRHSQPVPAAPQLILNEAALSQWLSSPAPGLSTLTSHPTLQSSTRDARPAAFGPLLAGQSSSPHAATEPGDWHYTIPTPPDFKRPTPLPGNSITRTIRPCRLNAARSESELDIVADMVPAIIDHLDRSSEDFPSTLRSLAATLQKMAREAEQGDAVQASGLREPPTKEEMDFATRLLNGRGGKDACWGL
ncbi:hypothetical protein CERZMDRAFT_83873 [Cercospora zeae-maydis SCOH1-5]|uniref:Uncharacterized protein n=1 Tax=Cercospora zeae-maydis SCOH1-5 TaxID=717836 RepID=A0A6A6FK84_9PEZI|nr:hypothetical protein CERZMDRAFT_83873 [Cercospora zeae-maydis SCOH1-5]